MPTPPPQPVLFVLNSLIRGGMEQMVLALGRVLRSRGRYRPVIACLHEPGPLADEAVADGFELHARLLHHKYDLGVIGRLKRLFAGHMPTPKQPAWAWHPAGAGTPRGASPAAKLDLAFGTWHSAFDPPAAVVIVNPGGDRMFWTTLARGRRGTHPPLILWAQRTPMPGHRLIEPINRLLIDRLDAIAVLGPRQAEAYATLEHLPGGRMHVVPNGLELERMEQLAARTTRAEVRAEFGVEQGLDECGTAASAVDRPGCPPRADHVRQRREGSRNTAGGGCATPITAGGGCATLVVMCVANPRPVKRVDLFCQAAAALRDRRPDLPLRFWLVGGSPGSPGGSHPGPGGDELAALPALAALVERLNLRPPGFVWAGMRADVPRLWPAADIGVCCSDSEGLSVSMLEAMAAGAAFVSTAVGEHPTVIVPERTGLLVPPGSADALADAIARLAADEPLRTRLAGAAAARLREQYTMERSADSFEELVRSLGCCSPRH